MPIRRCSLFFAMAPAALLAALLARTLVGAEPVLVERYNGPSTSWISVPNRYGVQVTRHERVREGEQPAADLGAELVRLSGPAGYSGMLLTPIGNAPVLDDLSITLRLRCDRPGVVPALRVIYPREVDPNTGRRLTAIVRGEASATGAGLWETLSLTDVPSMVGRHARAIGSAQGHSIDDRGAYADAVVLIVPSDPAGTSVWIEELTVNGLLLPGDGADGGRPAAGPDRPRRVRLGQVGFTVDDQAFFPRIISHNGEPLEELRKLGFNSIAFRVAPDRDQLDQCARLGLAVICPPPDPRVLQSDRAAKNWDAALAWLLDEGADARALDTAAAVVEGLRRHDAQLARPVLARPTEAWGAWSRLADGLVVDPAWAPAGRMLETAQQHLDEATRFARPGAPLVAVAPLTHSAELMSQVAAFAPAGTVDGWRAPADVAAEATAAAFAGARGVWIAGDARLAGVESDERVRLGLAMLNLRLALLEPWLRDGDRLGDTPAQQSGRTAVLFSRGRTRLLIPQPVRSATTLAGPATYVVAGVGEATHAYEFTPVAMRPAAILRMAGGVRVTLEDPNAWLLITADTRATAEVRARVASVTRRAEALQQALAVAELRHAEAHLSPLVLAAGAGSPDGVVLAEARRLISESKAAHAANDLAMGYQSAAAACQRLADWSRTRVAAANPSGGLESSPLAGDAATIIDHRRLLDLVGSLTRGENVLPGGDFEDHQSVATAGWRHVAREESGAVATVVFSGESPSDGERCLRIECPGGPASAPASASVTISSPEVNLAAGQLVEITGMVRVDQSSGNGRLSIVDSLGGAELGLVLDAPQAWRPFRLLRRATRDGPQRVTFAAQGPITASIDSVMVRAVALPNAAKAAILGVPALQRK